MPTYTGTNGNNAINGSNGDDVILGLAGEDVLNGGNGNDEIHGGDDDDTIGGGNGNDAITGDGGNDDIDGGNGDDVIDGGADNDAIDGGNGNDAIQGGAGDDNLEGGNGNDALTGGGGNDILDGENGFDTAYYSGSISEYGFFSSGGYLNIVHLGGIGADGHDQVRKIERLVFLDRVVDVGGGGNAPVAVGDHVNITEDSGTYSSGAASVKDNDFDFDCDALTVTPGVFAGTYGTLTLSANGTYSYTLHASAQALAQGENVQDSFNYTLSDGSQSDTGALIFHIAGLNDAPVANPDSASGHENQVLTIDVIANDDDADNGAVLTVTAASAPAGQGSASVVGNQVQFDPGADFDHLAVGATASVTVSYTIEDQHGATSSSTIAILVTGTNDGPVANPDAASAGENQVILVDVLANDDDFDDGAMLALIAASAPSGQGSASVVGDQVQFDPGTDFDHLEVGATAVVTISYTIEDEHGATASSTIQIIVTGANDGPVANPDAAMTTENATVLIDVLANDSDPDDNAVLIVTGATAGQGSASVVANMVEFDPGMDFDHLAEGDTDFTGIGYSIADQYGLTASSLVAVTVLGENDGPVANADTANAGENQTILIDVLANDDDVDDGAVLSVTAASAPAGQGVASVVGNQVQFDPGTDFDDLAVGQTEIVVVSYSIEDEHGAPSSSTVTITVTGANDAPTIDVGGTDAAGSVSELADGAPGENVTVHTDSGTIAYDDVDISDTHSASFTPQGGSYLGTFTLDPVNQAGDTVGWDFSVSDADLDSLEDGEVVTQTYTVEIDDGHGGTATQDVTITITGAGDDAGPDGTNWYIDNSAVGSTNVGSQANPFTSIAAFNAAQGTMSGPGVNDNVFLLAGTGSYAEADGINLLDGQVLTGVAAGPLRPTIVTTGGANHGIELAQNNAVTGVDIGDTTGAGISDGGGTVGSLTISDVAKSGGGQIADIDQGGTLDVTLNAAASTGSSGGAIDLAGVGGSFTISGATSITGSHSGGGLDVTGSSAAVSLAGGGTIDTGTASAVNFVGNSGSLHLGGGIDLVTTSGAGLNATGGGTVTVTGTGNSVSSTTGVAVTIDGTAIGAEDVNFESVSANGAANGIVLANTGSAGGLTVTGIGTVDGSGGTIQNTTGRGISVINGAEIRLSNMALTNAGTVDLDATNGGLATGDNLDTNAAIHLVGVTDVALDNVDISGGAEQGINGNSVTNFALLNSTIAGVGDGADEDGLHFYNMAGTSRIENTAITGSGDDGLNLQMQSGNLDLTISGGSVSGSVLGSGYLFGIRGSAIANLDLNGISATSNSSGGIVADAHDNATMNLRVVDSLSSGNNNQLAVSAGDSSRVDLEATGNSLASVAPGDFVVISLVGTAFDNGFVFDARIHDNDIDVANGLTTDGIAVFNAGGGAMNVAITNNDLDYGGTQRAINLTTGQDGAGVLRGTITGNAIDMSNATWVNGILAQSAIAHPSGEGASMDLSIGGVGGLANIFTHSGGFNAAGGDIRVRQRFDGEFNLDGYAGAPFDNAGVSAYLNSRNTIISSSTATSDAGGGAGGPTDDPGPGFSGNASPAFISVSVSAASVDEDGGTNLVYTFTRTGSIAAALVADFAITGTADTAADFSVSGATSYDGGTGLGSVTFAAGSATAQIIVDPTADAVSEYDESVVVDIGNSATANGSFARAFISNDDVPVMLMGLFPELPPLGSELALL